MVDTAAGPAVVADAGGLIAAPWSDWRSATNARIALGRAGAALPSAELLRLGCDHAMARDAIHATLDLAALQARLQALGLNVLQAASRAPDRGTYLRRPDLGRQLDATAASHLRAAAAALPAPPELALIVGDGLSALAVARHAAPLLQALLVRLGTATSLAPVVLVRQARVAISDDIGAIFGARLAVILIGERPGLSSPDSLGIYLTHSPRPGRSDAERNCISNVRAQGLSYASAAHKLAWLIAQSTQRGLSGVALKDASGEDRDSLAVS